MEAHFHHWIKTFKKVIETFYLNLSQLHDINLRLQEKNSELGEFMAHNSDVKTHYCEI